MNLKLKFEWFENDLSCGSIYLVTLKEVPPTEHEAGYYMLETPVLRDALIETGIQRGLKEWMETPLRLKAGCNAKAMAEKLYTTLFNRLDVDVPVVNCPFGKSR